MAFSVNLTKQVNFKSPFGAVVLYPVSAARPGINLLEGRITKNDSQLVFHSVVMDMNFVKVTPMVNLCGHNYNWGDATVRGYIQGDWDAWVKDYFDEVGKVFREVTPQIFLSQYQTTFPQERAFVVSDANGNLFWNLGHWIYTNETLYKHYREKLQGGQTALVFTDDACPQIRALNFENASVFGGVQHAVFGQRLIKEGQLVSFLDIDEQTGRPLASEFAGDFSHFVRLPFIPSLNWQIFKANIRLLREEIDLNSMSAFSRRVFDQDCRNILAKTNGLDPLIKNLLQGNAVSMKVSEEKQEIESAMFDSGYEEKDFQFNQGTGILQVVFKRASFGHSVIGLDSSCGLMFITKVYTDYSRKGLTLEETALLAQLVSRNLGAEISDVLLMSNGGDLRFGFVDDGGQLNLIKDSQKGEDLLYRGKDEYGITSAFIFSRRS